MGVKPVGTPVSADANLLFCHFIRQNEMTCGWRGGGSWSRLAPGPVGTGHSLGLGCLGGGGRSGADQRGGATSQGCLPPVPHSQISSRVPPLDLTVQLHQNGPSHREEKRTLFLECKVELKNKKCTVMLHTYQIDTLIILNKLIFSDNQSVISNQFIKSALQVKE